MAILKFIQTRVGSFTVDTLAKASCQRIPSAVEYDKMLHLHREVVLWAANPKNLDDQQHRQFFHALGRKDYEEAYAVLLDNFQRHETVTVWQLRRWDRWRSNFDQGFALNFDF